MQLALVDEDCGLLEARKSDLASRLPRILLGACEAGICLKHGLRQCKKMRCSETCPARRLAGNEAEWNVRGDKQCANPNTTWKPNERTSTVRVDAQATGSSLQ